MASNKIKTYTDEEFNALPDAVEKDYSFTDDEMSTLPDASDVSAPPKPPAQRESFAEGMQRNFFPTATEASLQPPQSFEYTGYPKPVQKGLEYLDVAGDVGVSAISDIFTLPNRFLGSGFGLNREKLRALETRPIDVMPLSPTKALESIGEEGSKTRFAGEFSANALRAATDPTSWMGFGLTRAALRQAVPSLKAAKEAQQMEKLSMESLRQPNKDAGYLKRTVAQFAKVPVQTLERASTKEGYEAISKSAGESPELLAREAQRQLNDMQLEKLLELNSTLDAGLKRREATGAKGISTALGKEGADVSASGTGIREAYGDAREGAGKAFEESQTANKFAFEQPVISDAPAGSMVGDVMGVQPQGIGKNPMTSRIDKMLAERGYDGSGEWSPNMKMSEKEFVSAMTVREWSEKARNIGDMVEQLRNLRKEKGAKLPSGDFKWDNVTVRQLDGMYRDAISEQLEAFSKQEGLGDVLVNAWKARNAQYHESMEALSGLQKRVGESPEVIIKNLETMQADDVMALKSQAVKNPNFGQLWEELSNGYLDAIIFKSTRNGVIDPEILAKEMAKPNVNREIFLGTEKVKNIQKALDDYKALMEENRIEQENAKKLSKYIQTEELGKLRSEQLPTTLKNIENDVTKTKETIEQLKILDALLGKEGADSFYEQAKNIAQARQLRMSPEGKMPLLSIEHTGRAALGGGAGLAIGSSAFHAGTLEGAIGAPIAMVAGLYAQSPHAAVQAFKLLNGLKNMPQAGRTATRIGIGATAGGVVGFANEPDPSKRLGSTLKGIGTGAVVAGSPELVQMGKKHVAPVIKKEVPMAVARTVAGGASGKGKIVERFIDENKLKLAGWKEYDKYSMDELIQQGYDGVKLSEEGETTYQIFNPQKLRKPLLGNERGSVGGVESKKQGKSFVPMGSRKK